MQSRITKIFSINGVDLVLVTDPKLPKVYPGQKIILIEPCGHKHDITIKGTIFETGDIVIEQTISPKDLLNGAIVSTNDNADQ